MEPLDPQLRRIVHDGMVQAVPSPDVEARVLDGLLARLSEPTPPDGNGGSDGSSDGGSDGGSLPSEGLQPAVAATGSSTTTLAVVLAGTVALAAAWVAGGPSDQGPEVAATSVATPSEQRASTQPEPAAGPQPEPATPVTDPNPTSAGAAPREPLPTASTESEAAVNTPNPARHDSPTARPSTTATTATSDRSAKPNAPTPDQPPAAEASPESLAEEVRMIAAAERALQFNDPREALALARRHATEHPRGQLSAERRAIELSARCMLGEEGALSAATQFLQTHPKDPTAPKIRARCSPEKKSTRGDG